MSYIRSISNPEKLYIYGSLDGVEIMLGSDYLGRVPTQVFKGLIKKYFKNYQTTPCKYKGATLEEINISGEFRYRFTYEDIKFDMWEVTWEYIVFLEIQSEYDNK